MEFLQRSTRRIRLAVGCIVCCVLAAYQFPAHAQTDSIAPQLNDSSLIQYLRTTYYPTTPRGYNAARDSMYQYLDVDETDSVTCVYSGLRAKADGTRTPDNGSQSINTEHSWPQSFYNEEEPMRGDIHHLYPTWSSPNQSRSNHPFAEIPDESTTSWWFWANGGSLSSVPSSNIDSYSEYFNQQFEPREDHKGNVARAMFYFWTLYQTNTHIINDESDNTAFFESMKETLYAWHILDPVDATELERSLGIEQIQGNKNPFIHDTTLIRRAFFYSGEQPSDTTTTAVFISEVYEANGGSVKYIELFNATDTTINLTTEEWELWRYSNDSENAYAITLSGIIEPNSFFVMGDDNESNGVQSIFGTGLVDFNSSAVNHNGNDKYLLVRNVSTNPDTVDSFGRDNIGTNNSFTANQVAYRVFSALPNDGSFGQLSESANGDTVASGNWVVFSVSSNNSNARQVATPGFSKGIESNLRPEALISGNAGWRLLTIPGEQATLAEITDDIAIQGVDDDKNASVFTYDDTGLYEQISGSSTVLPNGTGLAVYFFDSSIGGSKELPLILDTDIDEPQNDVSLPLNNSTRINGSYFTLVGNPYQANYAAGSITSTGAIQNAIHVLNDGLYSSIPRSSAVLLPWQGFWVESDASNAATEITFPKSGKTTGDASVWAYDKPITTIHNVQIGIRINGIEDQGCIISLNAASNFGQDLYDASKFPPARSDFAILSCAPFDQKYSIYSIPNADQEMSIPLEITSTFERTTHELFWMVEEELANTLQIQLVDNRNRTQLLLEEDGSLAVTLSDSLSFTDRFSLSIQPLSVQAEQASNSVPSDFSLAQNYPNPFNPSTTIQFSLPQSGLTKLSIINTLGQTVSVLVDEEKSAGIHSILFDAQALSSGIYFYQLSFNGHTKTQKMLLLK